MAIELLAGILRGTPLWVWALLAFLVWQGLQSARPRVMSLYRVWLVSGVFEAWGVIGLAMGPGRDGLVLAAWLGGAVAAGVLGALVGPRKLVADRRHGLVGRPGSWLPLVRNLAIFGAHFGLGVAAALRPDHGESLLLWRIVVSGASFGYFAGWTARFMRTYGSAPDMDLNGRMRAEAIWNNAA